MSGDEAIIIATAQHFQLTNCVAYSILNVAETRDMALNFSREVDFMIWFLVTSLTNGVFIMTSAKFELKTPAL